MHIHMYVNTEDADLTAPAVYVPVVYEISFMQYSRCLIFENEHNDVRHIILLEKLYQVQTYCFCLDETRSLRNITLEYSSQDKEAATW